MGVGGKKSSSVYIFYSTDFFLIVLKKLFWKQEMTPFWLLFYTLDFRDGHITSLAASLSQTAFSKLTFSSVLCQGEYYEQ